MGENCVLSVSCVSDSLYQGSVCDVTKITYPKAVFFHQLICHVQSHRRSLWMLVSLSAKLFLTGTCLLLMTHILCTWTLNFQGFVNSRHSKREKVKKKSGYLAILWQTVSNQIFKCQIFCFIFFFPMIFFSPSFISISLLNIDNKEMNCTMFSSFTKSVGKTIFKLNDQC